MRSSRTCKTSSFSDVVQHQLNTYALVASAAGVGALALSQPAEAKIVYTPANISIPVSTHFPLDLNKDGVNDLSFFWVMSFASYAEVSCLQTNAVVGYSALQTNSSFRRIRHRLPGNAAFALRRGANIGPKLGFQGEQITLWKSVADSGQATYLGQWRDVQNGYLGVKFSIQGTTHYGWVRLTVKIVPGQPDSSQVVITGYAYETIPDTPIVAGNRKGQDSAGQPAATPLKPDTANPATLGALAAGAAGLSSWRGRADHHQ